MATSTLTAAPVRDALFEAACAAAKHRAATDDGMAMRLVLLADEILCADSDLRAIRDMQEAAPELKAEVAGATTDPRLLAAITGGTTPENQTGPQGSAADRADAPRSQP